MLWVQIQLVNHCSDCSQSVSEPTASCYTREREQPDGVEQCGIDVPFHTVLRPLLQWYVQCWTLKEEKQGAWKGAGVTSKYFKNRKPEPKELRSRLWGASSVWMNKFWNTGYYWVTVKAEWGRTSRNVKIPPIAGIFQYINMPNILTFREETSYCWADPKAIKSFGSAVKSFKQEDMYCILCSVRKAA